MLVYVEVPQYKGKTFTLILHQTDTVAKLLALCYHTFYEAGLPLGPFILKSKKGIIITDMTTILDKYAIDTISFYKEASFEVEEVHTLDQKIAWSDANPPFITSTTSKDALFADRVVMKKRESYQSTIFILLNVTWVLALLACISIRWWSGLFPGTLALYFLQDVPSLDIQNAISLSPPRLVRRWLSNLITWLTMSMVGLFLIIGINLWIFTETCFTSGSDCFRGAVYMLLTSVLLIVDHAALIIYAKLLAKNFNIKIGKLVEDAVLANIPSSFEGKYHVNKKNIKDALQFVCSCPNHAVVYVDKGMHIDTVTLLPESTCVDVLFHLSSLAPSLNALVRDGCLENIALAISDRMLPPQSMLRSKLILVLARAIPLSANFGDQQGASDIFLSFVHSKYDMLTASDCNNCTTIMHTISTNEDLAQALADVILDGFQGLLGACVKNIGDHTPLLLADAAAFIRKGGDFDTIALVHVAVEAMPYCKEKDKHLATLALIAFNEVLQHEDALNMLTQPQYLEVWENVEHVLDTSLNSDHEPSRTCAKLIVALSKTLLPRLAEQPHPVIQLSLCTALEQAQLFNISHSERLHLIHFLKSFHVNMDNDFDGTDAADGDNDSVMTTMQ